jgi:hypothetical protein
MAYFYENERDKIFTEDGVRLLLQIHAKIETLLHVSGAVQMEHILRHFGGDSWLKMACVDHLVREDFLIEVTTWECPGQDRVFVCHPNRG